MTLDDLSFSGPVLFYCYVVLQITKATETSLSANQERSRMENKKLIWEVEGSSEEPKVVRGGPVDPAKLVVELAPMEIRTFLIEFDHLQIFPSWKRSLSLFTKCSGDCSFLYAEMPSTLLPFTWMKVPCYIFTKRNANKIVVLCGVTTSSARVNILVWYVHPKLAVLDTCIYLNTKIWDF